MRKMLRMRRTYCHTLVSPGMGATLQTFLAASVLMMEDLPTLGQPTKPTEICLRSACRRENWRRSWMRAPLPNGLVIDEWKASVGASWLSSLTQRAVAHTG